MPNLVDGILGSRKAISPKRAKTLRQDIHFQGTIIGDSGAHSYPAEDNPPYSCQDLLEFYAQGGITSFDSATWFRQARMSGKHNDFMAHGTQHTS